MALQRRYTQAELSGCRLVERIEPARVRTARRLRAYVRALLPGQPRLLDGWPQVEDYDPDDPHHVAWARQLRAAGPAVWASVGAPTADVFRAGVQVAGERRQERRQAYREAVRALDVEDTTGRGRWIWPVDVGH